MTSSTERGASCATIFGLEPWQKSTKYRIPTTVAHKKVRRSFPSWLTTPSTLQEWGEVGEVGEVGERGSLTALGRERELSVTFTVVVFEVQTV